jgi:hypothetical protein
MQSPARRVHIARSLGQVKSEELPSQIFSMVGTYACLAARPEKSLEALVPERLDHDLL